MKIVVIDGQGGRMGSMLVKKLRDSGAQAIITAIGTNSIATSAMLKAGADNGATGENPVCRAAMDADIILGPVGIIAAHAIMGEVTPGIAEAVSGSRARKILVPVSNCDIRVAGTGDLKLSEAIDLAVSEAMETGRGQESKK